MSKKKASTAYPDDNPKTVVGVRKPAFHAIPPIALYFLARGVAPSQNLCRIPPIALIHLGQAMMDGKKKYGLFNWREKRVTASIYVDAQLRHLFAFANGEVNAPDSGVHHLGHAMACNAILLDAEACGSLIDDRGPAGTGFSTVKRIAIDKDNKLVSDFLDEHIRCLLSWWDREVVDPETGVHNLALAMGADAHLLDLLEAAAITVDIPSDGAWFSKLIERFTQKAE